MTLLLIFKNLKNWLLICFINICGENFVIYKFVQLNSTTSDRYI